MEAGTARHGTLGEGPGVLFSCVFFTESIFRMLFHVSRGAVRSVIIHLRLNRPSQSLHSATPAMPRPGTAGAGTQDAAVSSHFRMKAAAISSKLSLTSKGG